MSLRPEEPIYPGFAVRVVDEARFRAWAAQHGTTAEEVMARFDEILTPKEVAEE